MKNFQIGTYGKFDEKKYARDFRSDFWGMEAFMFSDKAQAKVLADRSKEEGFKFGVHFPLINRNRTVRDPLFLSPDKAKRAEAISDFEEEAKLVSELGGQYILTHFPKPFIIDRNLDWKAWRFTGNEYVFEDEYPYEEVEKNSFEVFKALSEISNRYGIKVILENDAYNKYFYKTDLLHRLFREYPDIRLCLDFGRLHLLERVDNDFNAVKVISDLAPYLDMIHLWNVKVNENISGGHFPVLPEQSPEDGWGDMGAYLKALTDKKKDFNVHFEHRSDLISDEELERCYNWVASFF